MKKLILILVLLLSNQIVYAEKPQYRVAVDGLACPFCAYGIEKQLRKLDGILEMELDIEAGAILVTMNDSAILAEGDVRKAVERAGFSLRGFNRHERDD